ncbi:hypothetical protein DV737_g2812, partial [Chaetothyriales sp. CBS 132003]
MATEIVTLPLLDGQTPHDPTSRAATIMKETFDTLAQQPGFQRLYWGTESENPNNWRLAIDWDTVDHHINFTKTDQPSTPATETLLAFFPSSYSQADQDQFEADFKNFVSALETHAADVYTATASGWVVEELPIPNSESLDEKGKAFIAFIGWTSVQAHLDFRNAQAFKDNIHWLRGAKDLKGIKVVHVASTLVE